jgi:gamma-glutamylcyclotransferase (GGCT)/AIG2-like uncharacterized protein YtfP
VAAVDRVFVYGTLLDDGCVRRVTGRVFTRRRATLAGHRRCWPPDAPPFLARDPSATVEGDVLDGVDAAALAALDAYEDEGRLYAREAIDVTIGATTVRCWVYRALFAPHGTPDPASGA